jgi:hypothetical protein
MENKFITLVDEKEYEKFAENIGNKQECGAEIDSMAHVVRNGSSSICITQIFIKILRNSIRERELNTNETLDSRNLL